MADPESRSGGFLQTAFVTGLFSGYSPLAPGTAGSLVGLCIALIPGFLDPVVMIPFVVITFFCGVVFSTKYSHATRPDPSFIVIDEVVGMWVSLLLLPFTPLAIVLSFLAFRLFDIVKPFPARQLERLPGGWGIMMDDVAAGIYANIVVRLVLTFF